jgi:hypothetical protein
MPGIGGALPIILAIERLRSRGLWFEASPGKKKFLRPHVGVEGASMTCAFHPSNTGKHKIGGSLGRSQFQPT